VQELLHQLQRPDADPSDSATRQATTAALAQAQREQRAWEEGFIQSHPGNGFADRLQYLHRTTSQSLSPADTLKTAQELLPDDRSAILSLTTWGEKDQLVIFLVTKQEGLQTITFASEPMPELRRVFAEYAQIYGTEDGRHKEVKFVSSCVEAMCQALGQHVFNALVQVKDVQGQIISDSPVTLRAHLQTVLGKDNARLYLIPQDIFSLLPLAAACWQEGDDTRYLIEEYALHLVPGVEVMQEMKRDRSRRASSRNGHRRALIVGNPSFNVPGRNLPGAEAEALYVRDRLFQQEWDKSEVDMLLTSDATKHNFLYGNQEKGYVGLYEPERGYTLLHLSMHAGYDFASRTGLLELHHEQLCGDYEIAAARLRAECVVLSACLTFAHAPTAIEFSGLTAAFILAGAETVISTLFSVNDAATHQLMERLHHNHWDEQRSWSESLRAAQLDMLHSEEYLLLPVTIRDEPDDTCNVEEEMLVRVDYKHPYCWAGFIACAL
jgi:CHAT domain-containing protein